MRNQLIPQEELKQLSYDDLISHILTLQESLKKLAKINPFPQEDLESFQHEHLVTMASLLQGRAHFFGLFAEPEDTELHQKALEAITYRNIEVKWYESYLRKKLLNEEEYGLLMKLKDKEVRHAFRLHEGSRIEPEWPDMSWVG